MLCLNIKAKMLGRGQPVSAISRAFKIQLRLWFRFGLRLRAHGVTPHYRLPRVNVLRICHERFYQPITHAPAIAHMPLRRYAARAIDGSQHSMRQK